MPIVRLCCNTDNELLKGRSPVACMPWDPQTPVPVCTLRLFPTSHLVYARHGNGHARQERPASSPNRPVMQSSRFKLETRMGPTSAMKALQGNGENEQKLLIPEGLGQIPLWPGLGPRPHSCFDVFKHMDVPMLSKPMTYSPEDESFYLSNTKRNHKNLSLETEKTKLSMVSIFCPPGPCSSWRNQRGTSRWMVSGHGILGTLHPQVQLPGGMHEGRKCRVQSKMSRLCGAQCCFRPPPFLL